MSTTINLGTEESPEAATARVAAEAAAAAKGAQVSVAYTDKGKGINIEAPATVGADGVTPRPADIPEKFWDATKGVVNTAALLKAQSDGEAYIAKLRAGTAPAEAPATDAPAAATAPAAAEGTPVQKAQAEFAANGVLTAETYAALEAQGISRALVDSQIATANAATAALRTATYEAAGGEAEFTKMSTWATENMNATEIASINTLLSSSNPGVAAQGAAMLKANFEANADIDPSVNIQGHGAPAVGGYFKSKHEMTTAMKDPRYAKDSAYRQEVAQKIHRAALAKVNLFA